MAESQGGRFSAVRGGRRGRGLRAFSCAGTGAARPGSPRISSGTRSPGRRSHGFLRRGESMRRNTGLFALAPWSLMGPLLQRRRVKEFLPAAPILGEVVPPQATVVSQRITPPIFGAGLIEAIPDAQILQNSDPNDRNHDGISGRPNLVLNPETGRTEIG